ncbi:hypothetical protein CS8_037350 [Cupriavidus sp. 8B]
MISSKLAKCVASIAVLIIGGGGFAASTLRGWNAGDTPVVASTPTNKLSSWQSDSLLGDSESV